MSILSRQRLLLLPILALSLRILLDLALLSQDYFFGQAADSFLRTELSWSWSRDPFISSGKPFWLPLQFWIVGSAFWLLRPIIDTSEIIVPIIVNHLFLLGSLTITFQVGKKLGGNFAGGVAVILAGTMAYDTWITFSAQSEPITIFFGLTLGYLLLNLPKQMNGSQAILLGGIALLASATHYVGWFLTVPIAVILGLNFIRHIRSVGSQTHQLDYGYPIGLALACLFPILWLIVNTYEYQNPFQFLDGAVRAHAYYRELPLPLRMLGPVRALATAEPGIMVVGIVAIPLYLRKRGDAIRYLFPGLSHFVFLTITGALALSPPLYMPRATLLYAWIGIPFVSALISDLMASNERFCKSIGLFLAVVLSILGLYRAFGFQNRIKSDLRTASVEASIHLEEGKSRIIVEELDWTRQHALSVLSGHPDRVEFLPSYDLVSSIEKAAFSDSVFKTWIIENPRTFRAVADQVRYIKKIGDYIFVEPGQPTDLIGLVPEELRDWQPLNSDDFVAWLPPDQVAFGFSEPSARRGDEAGIQYELMTNANSCHIITADVRDYSDREDIPWHFLQQLVVNDIVMWSHDIGADGFADWQSIRFYIMPTSDVVSIRFRILALSDSLADSDLSRLTLTGIRGIAINSCP